MEIVTKINWVDILVAILMIRMSYVAFRDGLGRQIFPFFGSILIVIFALHYYLQIGSGLYYNLGYIPIEIWNFLSFLGIVVVLFIIIKLLSGLVEKVIKVEWHPALEKFGGLIIGVMRAYIITAIVIMVLALAPLPYLQWSIRDRSLTGRYFLMAGPEVYTKVSQFLPAVKIGDSTLSRDMIVGHLMSDKSVPQAQGSKEKNAPTGKASY